MISRKSAAPLLALTLLSLGTARAEILDRDPVPGTLIRRFSVPVVDSVLGISGGRSYARASDLLPGGSTPRSLWWTRAPGESRWTLLSPKVSPYYPWLLAPDPESEDTVYAADPVGTVFRSLDGGATWETRGSVPRGSVQQILVVGTDLLVVGDPRSCAPCRSQDGGRTWETATVTGNEQLVSAGDSHTVYSFSPVAIRRSTDGGRSFTDISPAPLEGASALAVAPSNPDVVYALSFRPGLDFVSRTTDGGASWTRLTPPEAGLFWTGLAVDPASAFHLAILGGGSDGPALRRVFESFDGGATWTVRPGALNATALRFPDSQTLQAFGRRELFESAGPGASWTPADRGITADAALLLAVARDGSLYLTSPESGGVWRSSNAGLTWESRGSRPGLQALKADPFDPMRLVGIDQYAASLSWSDDGGRTWTSRPGPRKQGSAPLILGVVFDPHRRNVIYAATTEDAWRSADRGATWSLFTGSLRPGTECTTFFCYKVRDVESIVPDPLVPGRFYVVAHTYETFRTENGGARWTRVTAPAVAASDGPRMLPDPRVKDHLYWGSRVETKVFESLSAGNPPWRTVLRTSNFGPLSDMWLLFDPQGRLVIHPQGNTATFLRRLADTAGSDLERLRVLLPLEESVQLLEPLVPIPGGGTRVFLLVPGLGLFRADWPNPHP